MTFLRGTSRLPATLMAHTGAIIRFTTSQLANLPNASAACVIVLPHGERVRGHFNPIRANPNITGADLRRWILATVPNKRSVKVVITEASSGDLVIVPRANSKRASTSA